MRNKYFSIGLTIFWSIALASSAFAQRTWTNTATGTLRWTDGTKWSPIGQPGAADDARVTNSFGANIIITDAFSTNVGNTATINFLLTSNNTANTTTIIQTNNQLSVIAFGVQIGTNATVVITTNAQFGITANGLFNNFNLNAGGQRGTLVLSNGANVDAFTLFVIKGTTGSTTNAMVNAGTIQFNPSSASQNAGLNFGQTLSFTNQSTGTIVKTSAGTGNFVGTFGNNNRAFINEGTITVNAGTQRIDPRDAFNAGGVRNGATGFIQVDTNAVLEIRRTTNAWTNVGAVSPTNFGTVFMNGGELRTLDSDGGAPGTNTTRVVVNASTGGIIRGNGLLDFTIRNENGGVIEARSGTLSTVASTQNNGTWVSTNFGGNVSVLNFTTGGFDLGGGTLLNSNGTIRLTSGANTTISTSYRQNWGTIDFAGAGILWIANSTSADSLTNEFVIKKTGPGISAIITGHGSGQNNYGFYNRGTLDLSSSGRFSINTSNSFSNPFNNLSAGTIFIGSVSTARLVRTSAAWDSGALPINSGIITLSNGVLEVADDSGVNSARFLRNAGVINGNGVISASLTNLSGGSVAPGLSIGTLNVAGSVVFDSNSTFSAELGATPLDKDLLAISGSVALDANSILNITGGAVGNVYTVATFAARSGTFGSSSPGYNVVYGTTTIAIAPLPTTHTISSSAGANGTIDPVGSVIVTNGDDQTFTITPDTCYQVDDVLVDSVSVGPVGSHTFTGVTADHTISASFAITTYTITASAGANGSISPSGAVGVNCGDDQGFTITPANGYHIVDVLIDSVSVGPVGSHTFNNVTANHTISASFAINTFDITATAGANGAIAPSGAVSVNYSNDQSFTISPDACYHVDDVLVDTVSVGPVTSYTFTGVTNAHTIDASFAIDTYTITATAGANGSISPVGAVVVDCGTNQDFTITADPGHPIVDVLVDALSVGPISSYTFSNVTANHTIDASFATNLFQIISIKREGADIRLTWTTAGGHDYIVQTNAPPPSGSYTNNFSDLITISVPGIGESTTNYLDSGAATISTAFYYRVRLVP